MSYTEHTWVTGELVTATKLNNMEGGIKNNETLISGMGGSIAPTFSASTAYSKGDYVFYEGLLYRFTANHAAGAWTGTDVTSTDIGADLTDVTDELNAVENECGLFSFDSYGVANGINPDDGTDVVSGALVHTEIDVNGIGIVRFISAQFGGNYGYAFYNSSNTYISGAKETAVKTIGVTVPTNAAKMKVTWRSGEKNTFLLVGRNFIRKYGVMPEFFGALGDGTNSDSASMTDAVSYCITNDCKMMCQQGAVYALRYALYITNPPSNFHIDFNNSTVKAISGGDLSSGSSLIVFAKSSPAEYAVMNYIKNLVVDCNQICGGIRLSYGYDFVFENVTIKNCGYTALYIADGGECYFNNMSISCYHNSGNSVGIGIFSSDYHFTDVAIIDADKAVYNESSSMYTRVHAWNRSDCTGTIYFHHVSGYPVLVQCHADTYETAFYRETDKPLLLIGSVYFVNSHLYDSENTPQIFKFATGTRYYASSIKCVDCMFDAPASGVDMASFSHNIQLLNCSKKGLINNYYNGYSPALVTGVTATGLTMNANRITQEDDKMVYDFILDVSGLSFSGSEVKIADIETALFNPPTTVLYPCMFFTTDTSADCVSGYITISTGGVIKAKPETNGTYKKLIANFAINNPLSLA